MTDLKFACPSCGQHLLATDDYCGTPFACPTCQQTLVVPHGAEAGPVAPAPCVGGATRSGSKTGWVIAGSTAGVLVAASILVLLVPGLRAKSFATQSTSPARFAKSGAGDHHELTAAEILQRTARQYDALSNYTASGTAVSVVSMPDSDRKGVPAMNGAARTEFEFSLKLGRPDYYCVTWVTKAGLSALRGALWSAGAGDYLSTVEGKHTRMANRDLALATAAGCSGGAGATLPAIFFQRPSSLLKVLTHAERTADERVEGEDCYVLKDRSTGMHLTLWITKEGFLLRQKQMVFGGQSGVQDLSDTQIQATLKAMGNLTAEQKTQAAATMKKMKPMLSQMHGTTTETYRDMRLNPALKQEDFNYRLPAGSLLTKSLF